MHSKWMQFSARSCFYTAALFLNCSDIALAQSVPPEKTKTETQKHHVKQPSPGKTKQTSTSEEIRVTGLSHTGVAQNTPASISVVTAQSLAARGITSFATLAQATSGVSLKSEGPSQTEIEMRGVTAAGGGSPTVGFYLGNLALTSPAGAQNGHVVIDPSLYDLNRIEIERGPQGAQSGVAALAGNAHLFPNQADPSAMQASAQSILSGTEGGGFNHANNLMFNMPLIKDKLAIRIVGSENFASGWINRIVLSDFPTAGGNPTGMVRGDVQNFPVEKNYPGSNSSQLYATRISALWRPTERLTITPSYFFETSHQNGISAYDSNPGTMTHYQPFDIAEPLTDQIGVYNLDMNYHFDKFDISSDFGYWSRRSTQTQEASESFNNPYQALTVNSNLPFYGSGGTGEEYGHEIDPSHQFSEEFKIKSSSHGPLHWVTGFYFSSFDSTWGFNGTTPNYSVYEDLGTLSYATTPDWFDVNAKTKERQYAVYGNVSYDITSKLTAEAGLRLTRYDYDFSSCITGWGSGYGAATPSCSGNIHEHYNDASPTLTLRYRFHPNLLVYATAARAMRPGGGNSVYPTTGPVWGPVFKQFAYQSTKWPSTYKPDSLWSYELGVKSRMLNDRLTVNADIYYEDWQHIQLETLPADWAFNVNGQRASIFGGEVETRAELGAGFTLQASASYLHYHLNGGDHWVISPSNVLPEVANVVGDVILTYEYRISDMYRFTDNIENLYTGPRYSIGYPVIDGTFQGNGAWDKMKGYDLTNVRFGIASSKGWKMSLFVNNLFNKHAQLENLFQENLPTPANNRIVTNQPLTGGLDVSANF